MHAVQIPVSATTPPNAAEEQLEVCTSVESLLQRKIEAMALSDKRLVSCKDTHAFAQAAHDAFFDHLPLKIGPDDIWFCIAQGFARHVNLNAEALRDRFVSHSGKLKLAVVRPDFKLGCDNPWPEAFAAFSEQIAAHVGSSLRDVVVADFTTTTAFHRAATEIALMDAFQAYFDYEMLAGCGIPSITLTGAPDDWRDIRRRAAGLINYGLDDWINVLLPVLDEIEATSRGHGDKEFWSSFFRYRSGSGGSAMTGWINVLFPYLKRDNSWMDAADSSTSDLIPNQFVSTWQAEYRNAMATKDRRDWRERDAFEGPYLNQLPSGVSSAPLKFEDLETGQKTELRFVAGMFGVSQDAKSLSIAPSFGWAVAYDSVVPPVPRPGHMSGWRARRGHQ